MEAGVPLATLPAGLQNTLIQQAGTLDDFMVRKERIASSMDGKNAVNLDATDADSFPP